eukprot:scaffold3238_cov240-Pinguiococcus_pyrenoidosus.AAC.4
MLPANASVHKQVVAIACGHRSQPLDPSPEAFGVPFGGGAVSDRLDPAPHARPHHVQAQLLLLGSLVDFVVQGDQSIQCAGAAFGSTDDVDCRHTESRLFHPPRALEAGHPRGLLVRELLGLEAAMTFPFEGPTSKVSEERAWAVEGSADPPSTRCTHRLSTGLSAMICVLPSGSTLWMSQLPSGKMGPAAQGPLYVIATLASAPHCSCNFSLLRWHSYCVVAFVDTSTSPATTCSSASSQPRALSLQSHGLAAGTITESRPSRPWTPQARLKHSAASTAERLLCPLANDMSTCAAEPMAPKAPILRPKCRFSEDEDKKKDGLSRSGRPCAR